MVLALAPALPLAAQDHRALLELGVGTLSPDDPFSAILSLRGSAGWVLSHRNAISLDYTRQSGNRSTSEDLGDYARQFLGFSWHHSFREAFYDDETHQQQYFLKITAGMLTRGLTRDLDPVQDLSNALFTGAALSIRYPLSARIAAVGTLEDDVAFIPDQTMETRCNAVDCYPTGSGQFYTFDVDGTVQHNFGLFVVFQWRP